MDKNEKKTSDMLKKLSLSLGNIEVSKKENKNFKTFEVVVLILITAIISCLMGGVIAYKLNIGGEKDAELQDFIKNYNYIVDNYYDTVDKSELLDAAIAGMMDGLDKNSAYVGDKDSSFSIYLEGSYKGTGIQVLQSDSNIVVYKVFENTSASKAGIQEGDIIMSINGKSTENMTISDFSSIVKGLSKPFKITYKRGEEQKTVSLKNSNVEISSVSSRIIQTGDKKIGYINVSIFANNTPEQFSKALSSLEKAGMDNLIIDLRDNSGGHLSSASLMISEFLDKKHVIYQIKSKDNQVKYYSSGKNNKKYSIAILVNSSSASASEVMASALKEQYGAILIGEKTYGKGTVQELQTLSDGKQYKLTTKNWLTSLGNPVEKVGISPDYEVKLSEEYFKNKTDENDSQLQKALSLFSR